MKHNYNLCGARSESYVAPDVRVSEVSVERGFATSVTLGAELGLDQGFGEATETWNW